jgi:hypothetical protein
MKKTEYVAEKSMKISLTKIKKPYFALESDSGGFHQGFFSIEADEANFNKISSWASLFEPYLIHKFVKDTLS